MLTNNQLNEPQPKRKTSIKELPKTKEIIMVKSPWSYSWERECTVERIVFY